MVYFFKSRCGNYTIYMGKDKLENEELIKYGLPEDVWFHVDDLSSAHVYLRMKPTMTLDDITEDLLLDCSALVKANSIEGCKKSSVYVVYTRWKNLKKTSSMVDGQVGFHRPENVRRIQVEKNGPIVRQLEKSKVTEFPNLYQLQQNRQREIIQQQKYQQKQIQKEQQRQKEQERIEAIRKQEEESYDKIFDNGNMISNSEKEATVDSTAAEEYEDDFF